MSGFTVGVIYEQVECRVQCRVESRVECVLNVVRTSQWCHIYNSSQCFDKNAGSNMCGPKTSKVPKSYYPQIYTDVPIYQGACL